MSKAFVTITVILLVIGVLLFITVGGLAAKVFRVSISTRTSDSFKTVVAEIESLEDGSRTPVAFFFDNDNNALLGFSPNNDRLEWVHISEIKDSKSGTVRYEENVVRYMNRLSDKNCPRDKSCMCICGELILSGKEFTCSGKITCKPLDRAVITDYTYLSRVIPEVRDVERDLSNSEHYYWKNGFAIIRGSKYPQYLYDSGIVVSDNIKTVYLEKESGKVAVCAKINCNVPPLGTHILSILSNVKKDANE